MFDRRLKGRKCVCGSTEFRTKAKRHVLNVVYINCETGKVRNGKDELDLENPDYYDVCVCMRCGKKYDSTQDIPKAN